MATLIKLVHYHNVKGSTVNRTLDDNGFKQNAVIVSLFKWEQGWYSGEDVHLPSMWPGFDSSLVSFVG